MNRSTEYKAWGAASAVLGIMGVVFGLNLLPTAEAVQNRLGTAVPLYLTWGMIMLTAVAAIGLAAFLVKSGLKEKS